MLGVLLTLSLLKMFIVKTHLYFHQIRKPVRGNNSILHFMKGGLGKVDVIFEPEDLRVDNMLAFESGILRM